jgi:hypothetical protein
MKTKILLAVVGITALCGGKGVAAGTVVGPIRAPTSATPQPITSQSPGMTMPATGTTVNSPINPNMTGAVNGNGYATNGEFNGYANTNSLYSITNPPYQRYNQPFGNAPGGSITTQPGANTHLPNGNLLPTANLPLPATVAPPPGANVPSTIIPPPNANSSATIVPPPGANSPQTPARAPSPGANSTPPNP